MIRLNSSTGDNNYYSEYKKSYEKHAESFSHVDASGQASMVDVKDKSVTFRKAAATASVLVGPLLSRSALEECKVTLKEWIYVS